MEREVIKSGRFNALGDELVVFNGTSDWGEAGWFVGERVEWDDGRVSLYTKIFFPGEDAKEDAVNSMNEDPYFSRYVKKGEEPEPVV